MTPDGELTPTVIQRVRALEQATHAAERRAREAAYLASLALDLTRRDEPREMFQEVVSRLLPLEDASGILCGVLETDDSLVTRARAGLFPAPVAAIVDAPYTRSHGGVVWSILERGAPVYLDDYIAHPEASAVTYEAGIRSMAYVPFGETSGCAGVLVAARYDAARPWTPEQRALLEATGAALRAHLERAERVRELRQIAAYAHAMVDVSQLSMQDLALEDMARQALAVIAPVADVDLALLSGVRDERLHGTMIHGAQPEIEALAHRGVPRSPIFAWMALEQQAAVWVDDYRASATSIPILVDADVRSAAFVPLADDLVLTALRLGHARPWTPRDRTLFEAAARTVRVAAERSIARARLEEAALTDMLTGLRNRRAVDADLRGDLAEARRHGEPFVLLVLDVDELKVVNDTQGHARGDELLCLVAASLQACFRQEDRVYRLGGDEFAVILRRTGIDALRAVRTRAQEAAMIVRRSFPGNHLSAGMAVYPVDGEEPGALMRLADARMYDAKWARKTPPAGK